MEATMKKFAATRYAVMGVGVFVLAVASAALAKDAKNIVAKDYDLVGFDRIDISGVYELDVRIGKDFSIELSGPDDEMARVETTVKDGVLYLDQRKTKRRKHHNRDGVKAKITLPSLVGLEVSGVVEGSVTNIDTEDFVLAISGVGDVELSGECGAFDAKVSGVGDLDAKALECRAVDIAVSGVGDASVFARDEVDARVSGMGDIDIYGGPKSVQKSSSMFADITVH
jgi:Putative auto-transporter adhesin, head GIN domain